MKRKIDIQFFLAYLQTKFFMIENFSEKIIIFAKIHRISRTAGAFTTSIKQRAYAIFIWAKNIIAKMISESGE